MANTVSSMATNIDIFNPDNFRAKIALRIRFSKIIGIFFSDFLTNGDIPGMVIYDDITE